MKGTQLKLEHLGPDDQLKVSIQAFARVDADREGREEAARLAGVIPRRYHGPPEGVGRALTLTLEPDMERHMRAPTVDSLLDLGGRVALVTGAGRGIGAAVARRLAEAGAAVAVHYRTSADGAEEVAHAITQAGGRAAALQADLTDAGQVAALFRACTEQLDVPRLLVNNAGVYPVSGVLEMDAAEWEAVVAANLTAVHLCTREAAHAMLEGRRPEGGGHEDAAGSEDLPHPAGSILNIASIEAEAPMPGHAHYAASKAGVLMYTRSAAAELGRLGIRVNAVCPGLIRRPGIEEEWPEGVARWREACPLERLGDPEDVADACLFLASDAARWITGAILRVDGGIMNRPVF